MCGISRRRHCLPCRNRISRRQRKLTRTMSRHREPSSRSSHVRRSRLSRSSSTSVCTTNCLRTVTVHVGEYKVYSSANQALTPLRSKVITVINRSEVVGRPLGALLANDGARVLSVDIDCTLFPLPLFCASLTLAHQPSSNSQNGHLPRQPTRRGSTRTMSSRQRI